MTCPHNLEMFQNYLSTLRSEKNNKSGRKTSNMVSTARKTNSINVKDNQNGRKKYDFNWRGKEIVLLLEKFYFSRFFVPFHAGHTLRKVFRNDLCSR